MKNCSYLQETYKLIYVKLIKRIIHAKNTILTITIENTLIKEDRIKTKKWREDDSYNYSTLLSLMLTITKENPLIKERMN